jgi:putative ABC transport system substrate-binding protein
MNAFRLCALLLTIVIGLSATAFAQTPEKQYRIGVLSTGMPISEESPVGAEFLRELARDGYRQGRNLTLDTLGAEGRIDRLPDLAGALVSAKVDAILTAGYPAARAAKAATDAIPIVALFSGDPVETGLAQSLTRPGGNVTGVSDVASELTVKRLELLKEITPGLRRVAMLWNADDLGMTLRYRAAAAVASSYGIAVQALGVREPEDFESAFSAMTRERPDAILMVSDTLTQLNRSRVYVFAAAQRLPAVNEYKYHARDSGLMSYGPDRNEAVARAGSLVARVLQGAKAAELPIEQPTTYELVVNLKTAKALGITIPPSILARADEVIE